MCPIGILFQIYIQRRSRDRATRKSALLVYALPIGHKTEPPPAKLHTGHKEYLTRL